jgi:hypothetical protein
VEQVTVNLTGGVRRENLDGRDYLVAPLSLIVPGVLNGSQGPLYYPLEDLQATHDTWNGMPIVAPNHPVNEKGQPTSARSPKVWAKQGIGHVYNATVDGKLAAEGWFDVEKTRKVDARILNRLEKGEPIELSTGLNLDLDLTPGVFNGVNYQAIARRYRPDHLAILPDQQGACSRRDGCGVNVNSAADDGQAGLLQKIAEMLGISKGQQVAPVANKDSTMEKLTDQERTTIVSTLVANCDCWKGKEETLKAADDQVLRALNQSHEDAKKLQATLKTQEAVVNAAKVGVKVGNDHFVLNSAGEWEKQAGKQEPANNKQPEQIKLEQLPVDIQEDIAFARNAKQQLKDDLIQRLVGNISDDEARQKQAERLSKRSLADLEADAALLPATNQQSGEGAQPRRTFDYSGAGAGNQTTTNQFKPTPLGIPVMNFEEARAS